MALGALAALELVLGADLAQASFYSDKRLKRRIRPL
jgi:hypothetical protein